MPHDSKLPRFERFRVYVTQHHIDTAIPNDSGHCMIADAIGDSHLDMQYRCADIQTMRCTNVRTGARGIALTPRKVQEALWDFDHGIKPEPFDFEFVAVQVVPMGRKSKNPGGAPRAKRRVRRPVGGTGNSVPEIVGGRPPPKWSVRRAFGLRAFDR